MLRLTLNRASLSFGAMPIHALRCFHQKTHYTFIRKPLRVHHVHVGLPTPIVGAMCSQFEAKGAATRLQVLHCTTTVITTVASSREFNHTCYEKVNSPWREPATSLLPDIPANCNVAHAANIETSILLRERKRDACPLASNLPAPDGAHACDLALHPGAPDESQRHVLV